jgi:hypothetical protein
MTSPLTDRADILMACRYTLRSNGVGKKGRAFVMLALRGLDDHELNMVYWALLHTDQSVNNLPSTGKPHGFGLGTAESDLKLHIAADADMYALCGVEIIDRLPRPELTPQQAGKLASCKRCQYAVKLYEPVFS